MNIARTIAAASAGGAALGLILAPVSSASAGAATVPVAAKAARPVVTDGCAGGGPAFTRPGNYGLSCDSSDLLVRLHWARWSMRGASGRGQEALNGCTPDCARGKYRLYPVRVRFWGTTPVTGHPGEVRYTHYTLTYTKTVPSGFSRKRTGTLL